MNSTRKGKRGELEAMNILRQWWGGDDWRRSGFGHDGADLLPPENFPFSVEVKHHKNARVAWLFRPTAQLKKWLKQARAQAIEAQRDWLLCVKAEGTWYGITNAIDEIGPELPDTCPRLLHYHWFVFPLQALVESSA